MLDEKFLLYDAMDRLTRAEHDLTVAMEKLYYLKNKIYVGHVDDTKYLDEFELEKQALINRINKIKRIIDEIDI